MRPATARRLLRKRKNKPLDTYDPMAIAWGKTKPQPPVVKGRKKAHK